MSRTMLLRYLGLSALALLVQCGDGGVDPPPPIDGVPTWNGTESVSDPALQVSCTDLATLGFTQSGTTFTGSLTLSGICNTPNGLVDNSGTYAISGGKLTNTNGPTSKISFRVAGTPDCDYQGTLTVAQGGGSANGSVRCTGSGVSATGSWDMAR